MAGEMREYLGDAVYATHDGYHIWLTTSEGHAIALEPAVFQSLLTYARRIEDLYGVPGRFIPRD